MAQPQADQQAQANAAIAALAAAELASLWPQVDWTSPSAVAAVKLIYSAVVAKYGTAAASTAAEFYDAHRATVLPGSAFRAIPADPVPQPILDSAVESAFKADPSAVDTTSALPVEQRVPARMDSSLQRHVVQPARDTVAANVAVDPAKPVYVRVPRGAKTCAFCVMLASREINDKFGGYSARSAAVKYHDHCDCEPVAVYPGQKVTDVSPNFQTFHDMYRKASANAGSSSDTSKILASMRQIYGVN